VPRALDPEVADIDDHLRPKAVVARRKVDHRTRSTSVVHVRARLPGLDVGDDGVDHRTDVVVRVTRGPLRDVVVVVACHVYLMLLLSHLTMLRPPGTRWTASGYPFCRAHPLTAPSVSPA